MSNEHGKTRSKPYVSRELHRETTRYYYTPIGMVRIRTTDNAKRGQGQELSVTAGGSARRDAALLQDSLAVSHKTEHAHL